VVKQETVSALFRLASSLTAVALALAVLFGALRIRALEESAAGPGDPVLLVSANPQTATVRLGEREFDLEAGAYDFYRTQSAETREKLLRLMRRVTIFNKTRWMRRDFVMEVDEKQRVVITLDQFIETGAGVRQQIHFEVVQRSVAKFQNALAATEPADLSDFGPSNPSLVPSLAGLSALLNANRPVLPPLEDFTLNKLTEELANWRDTTAAFLRKETAFAGEFSRDVGRPELPYDALDKLLHETEVRLAWLLDFKKRAERL